MLLFRYFVLAHVKSTQNFDDPLRFSQNSVLKEHRWKYANFKILALWIDSCNCGHQNNAFFFLLIMKVKSIMVSFNLLSGSFLYYLTKFLFGWVWVRQTSAKVSLPLSFFGAFWYHFWFHYWLEHHPIWKGVKKASNIVGLQQ